jgi:multidrug efflux pump subunit AcrA (membrane-fusion protein)
MLLGTFRSHTGFFALSLAILLLLTACAKKQAASQIVAPTPVTVATVEQRDVSLYGDRVATLDGFVNAQIQPQVSGYMIKQDYRERSVVQSGEVLFEIDPGHFRRLSTKRRGSLRRRNLSWLRST